MEEVHSVYSLAAWLVDPVARMPTVTTAVHRRPPCRRRPARSSPQCTGIRRKAGAGSGRRFLHAAALGVSLRIVTEIRSPPSDCAGSGRSMCGAPSIAALHTLETPRIRPELVPFLAMGIARPVQAEQPGRLMREDCFERDVEHRPNAPEWRRRMSGAGATVAGRSSRERWRTTGVGRFSAHGPHARCARSSLRLFGSVSGP